MKRHKTIIGAALALLVALCAVAAAGALVPGGTSPALAEDPVVLTVTGFEGQVTQFTLADVQALPVYGGTSA